MRPGVLVLNLTPGGKCNGYNSARHVATKTRRALVLECVL